MFMLPFIDAIFCLLFPAGFHTIYINLYVFTFMFVFFLIQKFLCNNNTSENWFTFNLGWKSFLFFLLTGWFYPILMLFYASIIFLLGFFNIIYSIKKSTPFMKYLKVVLLIFFGLFYFVQYGLWGLLFFRYSRTQALVFLVGLTIGLLFFIEQKLNKMKFLKNIPEKIPQIAKKLKILAVILPIVSASIFFPIIFIRPHKIPESNPSGSLSLEIMSYNIRNAGGSENNPDNACQLERNLLQNI